VRRPIFVFAVFALSAQGLAAPAENWATFERPGKFITALCATEDALWIGTEDNSLWRLDLKADSAKAEAWQHFTSKDTATDHVYGIAVDVFGRVWVGTLNQGASVYNGREWRNYGVLDGCSGERVFAIAADPDPKRGNVWIGTDHGLVCWSPDLAASPTGAKGTWRTYTQAAGLPSQQIYAIAVAPFGRVWVGTECDGLAWADPPYGKWNPVRAPAERSGDAGELAGLDGSTGPGLPSNLSNAILTLPDGAIVYGTNYGLGVCRAGGTAWTSWQGLSKQPYENYIRGMAADASSNLWLATRHKGLVRLNLKTGDVRRYVHGEPPKAGKGGPATPAKAEGPAPVKVYAAPAAKAEKGKAAPSKAGKDKAAPAKSDKAKPGAAAPAAQRPSLPDNYVFCVAVAPGGDVWAGTYGGGLARLKNAAAPRPSASAKSEAGEQTPAGKSEPQKPTPVRTTGAGAALGAAMLNRAGAPPQDSPAQPASPAPPPAAVPAKSGGTSSTAQQPATRSSLSPASLPEPPGPPTLEELNAMIADLARVPFVPPEKQPAVIRLDDDWLTKGDCLGRYGRYWGCWCAICSPGNYEWGAGPDKVHFYARIGPNCDKGDSLRYWVHWLYTKNTNTLEMPPTYFHSRVVKALTTWDVFRRQAEWDDHGEAYPMSRDGPHLYCTLKVPAGLYYLSLYNFNKDGHARNNRFRDYRLSVRPHPAGRPMSDITGFESRPEWARGRMRDFWGGAYKRFLVRGPCEITLHQSRNHSFNAILAGVFLDLVDEDPVPYFHTVQQWQAILAEREKLRQSLLASSQPASEQARRFGPAATEADAAARLFEEVERMRLTNASWWARDSRPFYAALARWTLARFSATHPGPAKQGLYARAATCYYQLGLYEKWEAGQTLLGITSARMIEKALKWDGTSVSCEGMGFGMVSASKSQNQP